MKKRKTELDFERFGFNSYAFVCLVQYVFSACTIDGQQGKQ